MEEETFASKAVETKITDNSLKLSVEKKPLYEILEEAIENSGQNSTEEENKKKVADEEGSKEAKQHNSYSTPSIDTQILYEAYKDHKSPTYQNVEVILYSYQVPWFATAMTDGDKIWFGPRMEFYDPHVNDRLFHELSHWKISTPYGTELDVETMAQLQLPRYSSVSVSYKI